MMRIVMNRILSVFVAGVVVISLITSIYKGSEASSPASYRNGLKMSNLQVKITSQGHTATFRLYDTHGAKEFYDQLPLTLDLSNFRDAQWMFYPPKKLNVTAREAYHDGKKGELSYYAPWGDVFMLYRDFYAGDEMQRLGVGMSGIEDIAAMSGSDTPMQMRVDANGNTIVFKLNDSQAAKELYAQLPLSIDVENYSNNEKIFYPPNKLKTGNTPLAKDIQPGTLAYYALWGDVVLFYGSFGSASGLYELGHAVQGGEHIKNLSGTIQVDR